MPSRSPDGGARCRRPLAAGARVVAKHFWRDRPPTRVGLLASERERRFGETALTFYRPGGSMNTVAVYPGSFDPITNGHLDIIERAANVFDTVIVAVLANPRKAPLLDAETRIRMIRDALAAVGAPPSRIEVEAFDGLTVDLCRAKGAGSIVRGLRAISDFETEMQLAHNNRVLAPDVDTVFFMTSVAERLRQLEPGQGDRRPWGRCLVDDPPGGPRNPCRAHGASLKPGPRAIIGAGPTGPVPADQGGHPDRHHLPRRAPRVPDRERQEAAADHQRGARSERRARPHR